MSQNFCFISCSRFLALTCSLLLATASWGEAESPLRFIGSQDPFSDQLDRLPIQQNIVASAEENKKYGALARIVHHHIALPHSREQYQSEGGFAVLWVTAHSPQQQELPISKLRLYIPELGVIELEPVYTFASDERHKLAAQVLGRYRHDSAYMLPLVAEVMSASLMLDFNGDYNDHLFGYMPASYPETLGQPYSLSDEAFAYPEAPVFDAMLGRAYQLEPRQLQPQ